LREERKEKEEEGKKDDKSNPGKNFDMGSSDLIHQDKCFLALI